MSLAKTPAPPYYAVVFTSLRTEGDRGYHATAERMVELAKGQPGFLGMDSVRGEDGVGITVAYFTRGGHREVEAAPRAPAGAAGGADDLVRRLRGARGEGRASLRKTPSPCASGERAGVRGGTQFFARRSAIFAHSLSRRPSRN